MLALANLSFDDIVDWCHDLLQEVSMSDLNTACLSLPGWLVVENIPAMWIGYDKGDVVGCVNKTSVLRLKQ